MITAALPRWRPLPLLMGSRSLWRHSRDALNCHRVCRRGPRRVLRPLVTSSRRAVPPRPIADAANVGLEFITESERWAGESLMPAPTVRVSYQTGDEGGV